MKTLPALSIRQPWAWLIVNGIKDVENRDWFTAFRGEVLIHAGKTRDVDQYEAASAMAALVGVEIPPMDALDYGGFVGRSVIHDCVTDYDSHWFVGEYGFLLRDSRPMTFVPYRGMLGFFNVPADVVERMAKVSVGGTAP